MPFLLCGIIINNFDFDIHWLIIDYYRFDLKPRSVAVTSGLPEWLGVPHRLDLAFVWGVPYWGLLSDGTPWDSADKRVSDIVMIFWANFIKYTNPSKVGVYIRWDNFTSKSPGFLVIDRSFNMSHSATMNYKVYSYILTIIYSKYSKICYQLNVVYT